MAYAQYPDEDEQDQLRNGPGSHRQPPAAGVSAPAAASTPAVTSSGSAQANPGGRFVNFQRFIDANAGTAQRQADQLAQNVDYAAQGAQQAVTDAQNEFNAQAYAGGKAEYVRPEPQVQAPIAPVAAPEGFHGVTPADYDKWKADVKAYADYQHALEEQKKTGKGRAADYKPQVNYTYSGPKSLNDVTDANALYGRVQNAYDQVAALQSANGIQAVQGGNAFDAALTSSVAGNRFANLNQKYAGLNDLISGVEAKIPDTLARVEASARGNVGAYNPHGVANYTAAPAAPRPRNPGYDVAYVDPNEKKKKK